MDEIRLMGGVGPVFLRLASAMVIGCALGLNRDLRHKPAGMRIHGLVALGSAVVMVASVQLAYASGAMDPGTVVNGVQGVITGVGFLGGGVILRQPGGDAQVRGLTTAASIWMAACLGVVCGVGHWVTALMALVLTLALLILGGSVEQMAHRRLHPHTNPESMHESDPDLDLHE